MARGASPERLILAENDIIHVDALAGTLPFSKAPTDPSEWGEKERHEQNVVTRTIAGTFIDLGAPSISLYGPEVMHTGDVAHLCTRIAQRSVEGPWAMLSSLYTPPAVCGCPWNKPDMRSASWKAAKRNCMRGSGDRWSADGRMELFVNIRCMRLFKEKAQLHVGAGITADPWPNKSGKRPNRKRRIGASSPIRCPLPGYLRRPDADQ
ncbi:MAG: chorismate-binding protein [Flavobacteriales bacterium]